MKRLLVLLAAAAVMTFAALAAATPTFGGGDGHWTLTLAADQTQLAVGTDASFSGALVTPNKEGVPDQIIEVQVTPGATCSSSDYGSVSWKDGPPTTDEDGAYSFTIFSPDDPVILSFQTVTDNVVSNCVTVTWSAGGGPVITTGPTAPPPPSNVFLCYSASQTDPGVWPASMAASLMAQGYWSPYAVKGNVTGGTNVGSYHLVCNLAAGQAAGQQFAGGDGFVSGADAFKALTGAPGWYPVVP
ncbi:MAG TPA: hypothetical protein VFA42_02960 [Gaiellaceae bacterium]|nr:hypothetical protein [Gaiellaceae bacterium]